MKPRPRTWALISLLLFIAAALCWHLGNLRQARQAARSSSGASAAPAGFPAPFPIVSQPPSPGQAPAPSALRAANRDALAAESTNQLRYRVSNTPEPLDRLVRNDRAIILRNALIDTGLKLDLAIPASLRADQNPGSYIVQSRGAISDAFRQALKQAGAEIVSYIPNNAYLVQASAAAAAQLAASPLAQAVLPMEPYYKLEPALLMQLIDRKPPAESSVLNLTVFPGQTEKAKAALADLKAEVVGEDRSPFGATLTVRAAGDSLVSLARLPSVQIIEKARERRPANDLTRRILRVATNTVVASNYLNLTGEGVMVDVNDTGVWGTEKPSDHGENGHPDLSPRVFGDLGDGDGHGTHVAGTIASSGEHSPDVTRSSTTVTNVVGGKTNVVVIQVTNVPGSSLSAGVTSHTFRGMAPKAKILSLRAVGSALPDSYFQRMAALSNAFVNNNSWSYGNRTYDTHAASFDAATRDALDDTTGSQPLLFVFAAGNSGNGEDNGLAGAPNSIESPGTSKNGITVGASDLPRYITNAVTNITVMSGGVAETNVSMPWFGMTDSSNEVTSFSSRGNVALLREGTYGRYKPDVVAPGAMVVSCRTTNWGVTAATNTVVGQTYTNVYLRPASTNRLTYIVFDPNAISFTVSVTPNASSPSPFPRLPIWIAMDAKPGPGDYRGDNTATIAPPILTAGTANYAVVNPGTNGVFCDVTVALELPLNPGNYSEVISNLNETLDPSHYYRYEWGTSMSAAAVSGMLALMQEYFQRDLGMTNESPALLKALLINGARSMNKQYDFDFERPTANPQGWGLANLPTTLPAKPAGTPDSVVQFIDQDATNALATGFSHTRTLTVNGANVSFPLRLTLVWTDPPANPVVGIKLVNDLDLIVTNLTTSEVYVGNHFREGSIYSQALFSTNSESGGVTNVANTNLSESLDLVNNVENVFIPAPLGTSYSVTVRARRVTVNGVDAAPPSGVVQDYALVASAGSTNFFSSTNGTSFTFNPGFGIPAFDTNILVKGYGLGTNPLALAHERVGANPPYMVGTNGLPEQWNFYIFTNTTDFTNVAFLTFLPRNIGFLQPNRANPQRPRFSGADVDLFVSRDPGLVSLDPAVIGAADRSWGRGGGESIIYTNATPNAVYYVGVKAEDQQAADYSLVALASRLPFSSMDSNGNQVVRGYPVEIPDGTPDSPGGTSIVAIATMPMTIQRVVVEDAINHELITDLLGNLSHSDEESGTEISVVLNNHSTNGISGALVTYDDSDRGDIVNAIPPDGPGGLTNFMGMEAAGQWFFDVTDNALQHTGRVEELTIYIEPVIETNGPGVYTHVTLGAGKWFRSVVDVPIEATNLHICVVGLTEPVGLYVQEDAFPTTDSFVWAVTNVAPPGGCFDWGLYDSPPLQPGRYYIGVYNFNSSDTEFDFSIEVQRGDRPKTLVAFASTNATSLLDDAVSGAFMFVSNDTLFASVEVGVRIDHERASDLVLHLITPKGTRVLLAENRGRTNTLGYGASITNVFTNVVTTIMKDGFENAPATGTPYPTGSFVSGWSVDSGDIRLLTAGGLLGFIPHAGTNAIDINGSRRGSISTNLPTLPGSNYLVNFVYSRSPDSIAAGVVPQAEVRIDGTNAMAVTATDTNTAWDALEWHTNAFIFQATSPTGTVLQVASTSDGAYGLLFDSFRVRQIQIVTNLFRYTCFSEDTAKAHNPIKFGVPPFANTNQDLTNLVVGSFEAALPGLYDLAKPVVEGWRVLTNKVSVVCDPVLAYDGTNVLALSSGEISLDLPTLPDAEYKLTVTYRGPDDVAWWPFDANPPIDIVGGVPAEYWGAPTLAKAEVNRGLALDGFGDYVRIPWPAEYGKDLGFTVEGWINATNPAMAQPLIEWNSGDGLVGVNLWLSMPPPAGAGSRSLCADLVDALGGSHPLYSASNLVSTGFQHIALTYQAWDGAAALYYNGAQVASTNLGLFSLANAYDLFFGLRPSGPMGGTLLQGVLDEVTFYDRGLSEAEIWGIYNAATNGKYDPLTPLPNFTVIGSNLFTNTVIASTNWSTFTKTFVAASGTTTLKLSGHPLGVLIDQIEVVETGNMYYLPEESIKPIFGENAFGVWQLEVWDNRLGGVVTNPASLLSWELKFGFQSSNTIPVHLTNHVAYSNSVVSTNLMFFVVDADCTNGGIVTHTLSADAPVDLLFNRSGFPTTAPGDYVLLSSTTAGARTLDIGGFFLPKPGRYFLAVRNSNPTNTANFILQVDVVCTPSASPVRIRPASLAYGASGFSMSWTAPLSASFLVQYAESLSPPAWTTFPRVITSSNGVFSFTDPSVVPGAALPPPRFYRLVQLPP